MLKELNTAIRTLTAIPIGGGDSSNFSSALPFFPIVGFMIGGGLFGLSVLFRSVGVSSEIHALILLLLFTFLTAGIHLDGVADCADGLFCIATPQRRIEIMRDSNVGTYGVLALIFILLFKWIALKALIESDSVKWLVYAITVSRVSMVELAVATAYAKGTFGTGAPFVTGANNTHRVVGWGGASLICVWCSWPGAIGLVGALFITHLLRLFFIKKIVGITGDCLGATCEVVETVLMLCFASLVSADVMKDVAFLLYL